MNKCIPIIKLSDREIFSASKPKSWGYALETPFCLEPSPKFMLLRMIRALAVESIALAIRRPRLHDLGSTPTYASKLRFCVLG